MGYLSDVKRGAILKDALDKYVDYLSNLNTRPSRVGQGTPRGRQVTVFVVPFDFDLAANEVVPWRTNADNFTALKTFINDATTNAEVLEEVGDKTPQEVAGFRPARVVWVRNGTRVATVTKSELTGLDYLKYTATRLSAPFGRKGAADDPIDVFSSIKALLQNQDEYEINRVSMSREYYKFS